MRMNQAPPDHDQPDAQPEHTKPGLLSRSDPPPDAAPRNRPPVMLIIVVVLLVTGFVVLHLTGIVGPGSH
jgi:hypothetical protein